MPCGPRRHQSATPSQPGFSLIRRGTSVSCSTDSWEGLSVFLFTCGLRWQPRKCYRHLTLPYSRALPVMVSSLVNRGNPFLSGYPEKHTSINKGWRHRSHVWKMLLVAFFLIVAVTRCRPRQLILGLLAISSEEVHSRLRNPAYLIKAEHGAVASENEVCSTLGVQVLKEGGNAVDAAVATTFCIGVVNMFSSGIGGGGFMTVRLPTSTPDGTSEVWTIDFRETAPALANATMYTKDPMKSILGGLAVGVPGEVRGLSEAHRRWGKLPWRRLVQPSAELASGWAVGKELGLRIQWPVFRSLFLHHPDWSPIFAPDGVLLKEGDIIRNVNLSRTLGLIAERGADAFYQGEVADAIVRKIRAEGGVITHEDLVHYKVNASKALEGTYRGLKVYTSRAPTSGPVLLHMLNLMEKYNLPDEGRTEVNVHRLVEAMKFGFAARTRICDPPFSDGSGRIDEIPLKTFSALISKNMTDDHTHPAMYYQPIFDVPEDHGTSHTSIVDASGMAVAVTSTVNLIFGSQVMDPVTGILFNDEMDDFSTPGVPNAFGLWPSPYNYPDAHKRPLSSIAPTIMEYSNGSFYAALGGSGGSKIFPALFQVILNLDWGLDIGSAIEYGRLHHQLYPEWIEADDAYPHELLLGLRTRGHSLHVVDINRVGSVVNAVLKKGGMLYAASDSRKNGKAAGY
ncbi:gamma-glutamyltranspeptidase-domain-containing protein [Russula earlei]|uniref:Gamma-glutamyltranspeptidase-domain-containing protein n=1 Tax=Russula earlei TaxID=71964 RepID=A0ACC0UCX4_9AGAM|nr:gamma-glutamyltranspeptidase-domain-containing protein [Russula earlei]